MRCAHCYRFTSVVLSISLCLLWATIVRKVSGTQFIGLDLLRPNRRVASRCECVGMCAIRVHATARLSISLCDTFRYARVRPLSFEHTSCCEAVARATKVSHTQEAILCECVLDRQ